MVEWSSHKALQAVTASVPDTVSKPGTIIVAYASAGLDIVAYRQARRLLDTLNGGLDIVIDAAGG